MANVKTFNPTGGTQTWAVPANIGGTQITVELWGAAGGKNRNNSVGGYGGRVVGKLNVAPGDVLYIYPGSMGGNSTSGGSGGTAGWPAGGKGGAAGSSSYWSGAGGGGSSDIRKNSSAYTARVVVAGGGGGCGYGDSNYGGYGGGTTGGAGRGDGTAAQGKGGTQAAGGAGGTGGGTVDGAAGSTNGTGGAGGNGIGSGSTRYNGAPGGGGGWTGGGGAGQDTATAANYQGGGGGGSNYVGGLATVTTNTQGYTSANGNGKVVITYDLAPNAPMMLNAPPNNDLAQPITVGWTFSDPDSSDVQTKADVRWRVAGTTNWTTITAAVTGAAGSYAFPANTFSAYAGQQIEWQVRTSDATGYGPWAASNFFWVYVAPDGWSFNVPPLINSNTPQVTGGRISGGPFVAWQARVVNDQAGTPGSTVLADTGVPLKYLATPVTSTTFNMPNYAYANGTSYHLQIRVTNPYGVWGPWTDSGALVANVFAPLQPTLVLTAWPVTGSARVVITNPGADPYPPVVNRLYRTDLATGVETMIQGTLPPNGAYTDYTIGFNRPFRYRVEAVSAPGGITSSA
jgi:hypothetical protein